MSKKVYEKGDGAAGKWGKGKTDPSTWFAPGCKPGPGRPKGSKNRSTLWQKINAEKVPLTKGGKTVKVPKGDLKYHQISNRAANGDMKAINKAIELDDRFSPAEPAAPTPQDVEADLHALDNLIALRQKFAKSGTAS